MLSKPKFIVGSQDPPPLGQSTYTHYLEFSVQKVCILYHLFIQSFVYYQYGSIDI